MRNSSKENTRKVLPMPKHRKITAILGEEGEVTGYISLHKKNRLGVRYVATFQDGLAWLSMQDLTGEQLRVLMFLMSRLDFDNYLRVPQKDICESLKLNKSNVSKAIKRLTELSIILPGPMAGRSKTYRMNPKIAHRGAKNYENTIVEYEELRKRFNNEQSQSDFEFHPAQSPRPNDNEKD